MTAAITRKGFLRRVAGSGAGATVAGEGVLAAGARAAAPTLDASFISPYAPHPVIAHPKSWFTYTALMPGVAMPYQVVICNRALGTLRDIDGAPDLSTVPSDSTMLMLCLYDAVPRDLVTAPDISLAMPLSGRTMQFSDLGGGEVNWQGFRQFLGWYVATVGTDLYSIETRVYVGADAGSTWGDVQPVVNSIRLSA